MATARENVPSQRVVDACYMGGAFWVVTHGRSAKVREMKANPCVSLCSSFHTFKCKAHFMGHPLLPASQAAREALAGAFEPWHFACNDEGDSNLCYLRIVPERFFPQGRDRLPGGFHQRDGGGIPLYSSGRNGFTAARKYSGILKRAGAHKAPALILHL